MLLLYWFKNVSQYVNPLHEYFKRKSVIQAYISVALLSVLSTLFQSAGGLLPVIGLMISPLSTAPIILSTIISLRLGMKSYALTILLILFIQPSELMIFPFTTGMLGLGCGIGFYFLEYRISIILIASISLFSGVCLLLYVFKFPILGPLSVSSPHFFSLFWIYLFSFIYSLIWVEFILLSLRRLSLDN
jgi:hypothetical protein